MISPQPDLFPDWKAWAREYIRRQEQEPLAAQISDILKRSSAVDFAFDNKKNTIQLLGGVVSMADVIGLIAALDDKVAVAGDTMTGALLMPNGTTSLPSVSFSSAPSAGILYQTSTQTTRMQSGTTSLRLSPTSAVMVTPVYAVISPTTGRSLMSVQYAGTDLEVAIDKTPGNNASWRGGISATEFRWRVILGDNAAESGSNVGSDFVVRRFSDTGADLGAALKLVRSTGDAELSGVLRQSATGTAAAPAITVGADTDTGWWRSASNEIGLSTGGTNRLTVSTTAVTSTLPVVLPGNPTTALQAATKQYVDAGVGQPVELMMAVSDETTTITTGTAKLTFRMPYAMTLASVRANLNTVSSSGLPTVDVKKNGVSIFSTLLTIDASEKTSVTAATAAVLSTTSLADDDEMTIDITVAGTGAKGLKITFRGTRA